MPTYQLTAQVPNAANLVVGNEVRIGGARVGVVDQITPLVHKSGRVTALLRMKLQTTVKPLAKDTTVIIRPRSALGLKYVQLTPGNPKKSGTLADGSTIALKNATPEQVEIDEVFNTFDAKTRAASARNLDYFSGALAGRGVDLNEAIRSLDPLLLNLIPVARNLASPRTQLRGFVRGLAQAAAEVAPVAEQQASLFRNLDTTFGALAEVTPQIQASITGGPPTLVTAIALVPRPAAVPAQLDALFTDLAPGVRALARTAPTLSNGARARHGGPPEDRAAQRARGEHAAVTCADFAEDPMVTLGLKRLTQTAVALKPTLSLPRSRPDDLQLRRRSGSATSRACSPTATRTAPGSGSSSSSRRRARTTRAARRARPANGPSTGQPPAREPYPYTASPGQPKSCEAGNARPERLRRRQDRDRPHPGQPGHATSTRPRSRRHAGNGAASAQDQAPRRGRHVDVRRRLDRDRS